MKHQLILKKLFQNFKEKFSILKFLKHLAMREQPVMSCQSDNQAVSVGPHRLTKACSN